MGGRTGSEAGLMDGWSVGSMYGWIGGRMDGRLVRWLVVGRCLILAANLVDKKKCLCYLLNSLVRSSQRPLVGR